MVIAVTVVRVVEMALDQVIGVVAMRHRRMATAGAVGVTGGVAGAAMVRRALGRIGRVDPDRVFIDVIAVDVVQVPVVQIVDVAGVQDGGMAAAGTVNVIVSRVDGVRGGLCHGLTE